MTIVVQSILSFSGKYAAILFIGRKRKMLIKIIHRFHLPNVPKDLECLNKCERLLSIASIATGLQPHVRL